MPRGGFREGAGRPKSGRKVHTIRATDEEWKLIKAYAEQVKLGKLPELSKAKEVKPVKETKAAVKKAKRTDILRPIHRELPMSMRFGREMQIIRILDGAKYATGGENTISFWSTSVWTVYGMI